MRYLITKLLIMSVFSNRGGANASDPKSTWSRKALVLLSFECGPRPAALIPPWKLEMYIFRL